MRVLVLGAGGMLGHTLIDVLAGRPGLDVVGTVRDPAPLAAHRTGTTPVTIHPGIDVARARHARGRPGRCPAGRDRQCDRHRQAGPGRCRSGRHDRDQRAPAPPSRPARRRRNARLIHVSTDCVFSGRRGGYTEDDAPDPVDLYGRTKLLGEVIDGGALTIRTSIIGHELATRHGLVDWFLAQTGTATGFTVDSESKQSWQVNPSRFITSKLIFCQRGSLNFSRYVSLGSDRIWSACSLSAVV